MTPTLRPFQVELKMGVAQAWAHGARNVVMQLATGGGKTVVLSDITRDHQGFACVMAHRTELVTQLSLTLARYGVRHAIIGSDATRRNISRVHVEELGRSWVDMNARCIVASVDTLVRADVSAWAGKVTLAIPDEGHHVVRDNKWHRALSLFTNPELRVLMPTATPVRADGKGLGDAAHGGAGIADAMVQGPPMRWLIERGYLCDYRIICPTSDLVMMDDVSASGDWSPHALKEASERSHIVGDVVQAYLAWGTGLLGATFATDVETAMRMTMAYTAAGVRAACLTGKTDDYARRVMLKRFARREIDMLVSVDIISEGFDLPAIEYLGMARPSQSYSLYAQQFGRSLRALEGKGRAVIVDHAGNVMRHQGPPDRPKVWSLASRDRRASRNDSGIPYRVCTECLAPYERIYRECPYCGHYPEPAARSSPAHVDGDMAELSPEVLERLRTAVEEGDQSLNYWRSKYAADGWSPVVANTQLRNRSAQHEAQVPLRAAMATWGGRERAAGLNDGQIQRGFWHRFGVSTLEAMALSSRDALALHAKIGATFE